jgi:hypothetical protein
MACLLVDHAGEPGVGSGGRRSFASRNGTLGPRAGAAFRTAPIGHRAASLYAGRRYYSRRGCGDVRSDVLLRDLSHLRVVVTRRRSGVGRAAPESPWYEPHSACTCVGALGETTTAVPLCRALGAAATRSNGVQSRDDPGPRLAPRATECENQPCSRSAHGSGEGERPFCMMRRYCRTNPVPLRVTNRQTRPPVSTYA